MSRSPYGGAYREACEEIEQMETQLDRQKED